MARGRDRVALGVIGRPHGVRGLVKVRPYTARPGDVAAYGPVSLADGRRFEIAVVGAAAKGAVTVRLAGVADRDAAAALAGEEIFVARAALPEAAPEEYYHHDLIGLGAVGVDGTELGRVAAVHDFGAGPVLEIEAPDRPAYMVPFTAAAVPCVDVAAGRLTLDLPPGWLEEEAPPEGASDERDG